jgi:hypothetical protein
MFFPEGGVGSPEVRALCAECPVRAECYEFALTIPQDEDRCGIFAGTSARDRKKIREARRRGEECPHDGYIEVVKRPSKSRGALKRQPAGGYRWDPVKQKYVAVKERY